MADSALMADPSPTLRRKRLGDELRRLREAAHLDVDAAADHLSCSAAKVYRLETGANFVKALDVRNLLDLYGVAGSEREGLLELAAGANERQGYWVEDERLLPARFSTFAGFEADAETSRSYNLGAVNGLLQTEAYARAMIRAVRPEDSADAVERLVAVRIRRQEQLLVAREPALRIWTILDEAVLRRPVGGPEVMVEQLHRIIAAADRPNVTVQILPYSVGAHAGLRGEFTVLDLEGGRPALAFSEAPTGNVTVEKSSEVSRLAHLFDHLRATALPPRETASFIGSINEERT